MLAAWLCASCACAAQEASLSGCVDSLRRELPQHPQVRAESFDAYTRAAKDLRPAIEAATTAQPEFVLPIWDYLARRVDAQRIEDGRDLLRVQAEALRDIERLHGVDAASATAVFGVETDYGRVRGKYPVIDATLSRACLDLSSPERKRHFFAALWLLQQGWVAPDDFSGSWAGAFGLTQFMPGTLVQLTGDDATKLDIVHSVPDALAATARYLKSLGWVEGLPWGWEVQAPRELASAWGTSESGHACLGAGQPTGKCKTVEQWKAAGVRPVGSPGAALKSVPAGTRAALLMPAGPEGPTWLVTTTTALSGATTAPMPMRWRSACSPTRCAAPRRRAGRGRPTTRAYRAPSCARCRPCWPRRATARCGRTVPKARSPRRPFARRKSAMGWPRAGAQASDS